MVELKINSNDKMVAYDDISRVAGISFNKRKNKWIAKISPDRNKIILGEFDSVEDAVKTRREAELKYYGEYKYISDVKKLSFEEKQDWEELYFYVKYKIFGYDENQNLPTYIVLRLKGLLTGKFMESNNIESGSHYSYEVVLNTFKFCNPEINKALRTVSFKDEKHKMNYIVRIVENNLNNVYMRMKNAEKAEDKIEIVDTTIATNDGIKYKKRETKKDKFDDLW